MFSKLLGFALLLGGVYFFGQNILFVGPRYGIDAAGAVLSLTVGIFILFFLRGSALVGWAAIGLGILLVFVDGRAFLQPTTLWEFCLGTALMAAGYRLISQREVF